MWASFARTDERGIRGGNLHCLRDFADLLTPQSFGVRHHPSVLIHLALELNLMVHGLLRQGRVGIGDRDSENDT